MAEKLHIPTSSSEEDFHVNPRRLIKPRDSCSSTRPFFFFNIFFNLYFFFISAFLRIPIKEESGIPHIPDSNQASTLHLTKIWGCV